MLKITQTRLEFVNQFIVLMNQYFCVHTFISALKKKIITFN